DGVGNVPGGVARLRHQPRQEPGVVARQEVPTLGGLAAAAALADAWPGDARAVEFCSDALAAFGGLPSGRFRLDLAHHLQGGVAGLALSQPGGAPVLLQAGPVRTEVLGVAVPAVGAPGLTSEFAGAGAQHDLAVSVADSTGAV